MLKDDYLRLQELSKRNPATLSQDSFNRMDGQHMLRMCERFLPMLRTEERNKENGEVTIIDRPNYGALSGLDEVSLLTFLKSKKAF